MVTSSLARSTPQASRSRESNENRVFLVQDRAVEEGDTDGVLQATFELTSASFRYLIFSQQNDESGGVGFVGYLKNDAPSISIRVIIAPLIPKVIKLCFQSSALRCSSLQLSSSIRRRRLYLSPRLRCSGSVVCLSSVAFPPSHSLLCSGSSLCLSSSLRSSSV